jgi:hypothetical protein
MFGLDRDTSVELASATFATRLCELYLKMRPMMQLDSDLSSRKKFPIIHHM